MLDQAKLVLDDDTVRVIIKHAFNDALNEKIGTSRHIQSHL